MKCPKGCGPMTKGEGFWVCLTCGEKVESKPRTLAGLSLETWPAFLAIPLKWWAEETHPVARLWRICDAVELTLRFYSAVLLGFLYQTHGQHIPDDVSENLRELLQRPTFGQWLGIIRLLTAATASASSTLVEAVREGFSRHLVFLIGSNNDDPAKALLPLRNLLAHGGGIPSREAERYFITERHEQRALEFFRWQQERWVKQTRAVWVDEEGTVWSLQGLDFPQPFPLKNLPSGLMRMLEHTRNRVLLLAPDEDLGLDLLPICRYAHPEIVRSEGFERDTTRRPQIYIRAEARRCLFNALGGHPPLAETPPSALDWLARLFQLEPHTPTDRQETSDFWAEAQEEASRMVGRKNEKECLLELLKTSSEGLFWLWGKAGIGKSALTAAVAVQLRHSKPEDRFVIYHRFKQGDGRNSRRAFLERAVTELLNCIETHWHKFLPADAQYPNKAPDHLNDRALEDYWTELLGLVARLQPRSAHPQARPPTLIIILDGLDEIARHDPDFIDKPLRWQTRNTVWLLVGRPDDRLQKAYASCRPVFPNGLPPLQPSEIRTMLIQGLEAYLLAPDVLRADAETKGTLHNRLADIIAERSEGLPAYVRFVIDDLRQGRLTVDELIARPDRLPRGLKGYYADLCQRYQLGALGQVLTPLLATLACARSALDVDELTALLAYRRVVTPDDEGRQTVEQALRRAAFVLIESPTVRGTVGYRLYHDSFRAFLLDEKNANFRLPIRTARQEWSKAIARWSDPDLTALKPYLFRFGIPSLIESNNLDSAQRLLSDARYLMARVEAGQVFALLRDMLLFRQTCLSNGMEPAWNSVEPWYRFIDRQSHILSKFPFLFYQQARNEPDDSIVTRTVANIPPPGPWLRWVNKPKQTMDSPLVRILEWHTGRVNAVAVTPDGRFAISGSSDKTLRVWELATGECVRILEGHTDTVSAVTVTPDGRFAISGSSDKTLRVWELATGECVRVLEGHADWVYAVAVTPDGRFAISGSSDKTLRVWELATGKCVRILEGHTETVNAVAVTPDGRFAISGSSDKTLRVWKLATGECVHILEGHTSSIDAVAVTTDGRFAISGSDDTTLRVWDLATGECVRILKGHTLQVATVAVASNGRFAISGSWDKTLRVWDLTTGECVRTLEGHTWTVNAVAVTPDGRLAISGSSDKTLRVWKLATGECVRILEGHADMVHAVVVTPDGRFALSGSADETLRVWELATGECVRILEGHTWVVEAVAVTPDGRFAISGSWDKTLRVWDLATGECVRILEGHTGWVNAVAVTPDGKFAISGSWDATLRVWELTTGECVRILKGHTGGVEAVAVTLNGRFAISAVGYDAILMVWELTTGECVRTLSGHTDWVNAVAVTPDGRFAISGSEDKTVRVWELKNGQMIALYRTFDKIEAIAASSDGRTIVCGDESGRVYILRLEPVPNTPDPLP